MAKFLRISMGDDPDQLIDIFPTQQVGRVSWEDDGAGGVSVTAAPAGEVGPAKRTARRSLAGSAGTEIVGALTGKLAARSEELRARGLASMKASEEAEAAAEKARNPERKREPEADDAES
jgi:hypothetical protein